MKITFLGTGTSQGVPIIGCTCEVCTSINPADKRLRSSIFIETKDKIVVDTGTDFRQQMLDNRINDVDAIIYTHEHKDHIAGLDDIRPINHLQHKDISIYAEKRVMDAIKVEFHYAFGEINYPGLPQLIPHEISNAPFTIGSTTILPIRGYHHKLPLFGYRVNNVAYLTDFNLIPEEEMPKLHGLDVLIINSLRKEPHISHFNLSQALEIIERVKPKRAYLTHISHLLGLHNEVNKELPKNVLLAYDGLSFEV